MRRYLWIGTGAVCAVLIGRALVANESPVTAVPPTSEVLHVGDRASGSIHRIDRPGVYGMGLAPEGSSYAIVGNNLVRLDSRTDEIEAVIRGAIRPVNEAALK